MPGWKLYTLKTVNDWSSYWMEFDCVTTDSGGCDCSVVLRKLIASASVKCYRRRVRFMDFVIFNWTLIGSTNWSRFLSTIVAEGQRGGFIEVAATVGSIILMVLTFPISIFICFKGMTRYFRVNVHVQINFLSFLSNILQSFKNMNAQSFFVWVSGTSQSFWNI